MAETDDLRDRLCDSVRDHVFAAEDEGVVELQGVEEAVDAVLSRPPQPQVLRDLLAQHVYERERAPEALPWAEARHDVPTARLAYAHADRLLAVPQPEVSGEELDRLEKLCRDVDRGAMQEGELWEAFDTRVILAVVCAFRSPKRNLRPEVSAFALLMERQLQANDHKPGWKGEPPEALWERLREEATELLDAIRPGSRTTLAAHQEQVGREAADVANFSMMIADVCGALDLAAARSPSAPTGEGRLQDRVAPWMQACFGPEISGDRVERGDRLLEEVLELLQSGGYDPSRVATLVAYVWGRPVGEPAQEVGGVMITLAAYCLAHGLDMHDAGDAELARIWTKVEQIRAKQASKRGLHTPLPTAEAALAAPSDPPQEVERLHALIDKLDRWSANNFAEAEGEPHDDMPSRWYGRGQAFADAAGHLRAALQPEV